MTGPRGVRPARVELTAGTLEDLRDRIAATRAAGIPPGVTGRWGIDADALAEILARWRSFDADALAQRLDAIDQVDVAFDDGTVRALHFRGEVEHATPLVVVHGWPSTVLEAIPLAERLASPSRHGGDPADAFHVVVPALPGFPLSSPAGDLDGYTGSALADRCTDVMLALGYERFGASGGDIGARVAAWLGARHPDRVLGVHVTSNALWHELPGADLREEERSYVERLAAWDHDEGAYMHLHAGTARHAHAVLGDEQHRDVAAAVRRRAPPAGQAAVGTGHHGARELLPPARRYRRHPATRVRRAPVRRRPLERAAPRRALRGMRGTGPARRGRARRVRGLDV